MIELILVTLAVCDVTIWHSSSSDMLAALAIPPLWFKAVTVAADELCLRPLAR